jgi:pimeloyl-ACP methyl ester carboxylesterase/predicted glycosyltransferase
MRAREPDVEGYVERDGIKVGYEVFGTGDPTVVLTPTWSIVDSRHWKAQVPYLARHFRVVTVDPRGNGRSDRPTDPAAYSDQEFEGDLLAVLDEVGAQRAVLAGLCTGARRALTTAARHPDRVLGVAALAPNAPWLPPRPERAVYGFEERLDTDEGWAKYNRHYWQRDYRGFVEFFFRTVEPEPHSTKVLEDAVGWALQTTPEVLAASLTAPSYGDDPVLVEDMLRSVRCPVLVVSGSADRCQSRERIVRVAELTRAREVVLEGAGHLLQARQPVVVNRLLHEFVRSVAPAARPPATRRWTRPLDRPRKVLYLSSPIGLGHAERDAAIVDALRRRRPGVQVDWLAQHPVTEVLARRGERIHPASAHLANESAHVESEAGEHDLHAFQAVRRMDEILVANFMVFADLVEDEHYDLWVGDEAWELDHFLHENPELKRAPYAWLTDFVGWLPMPSGGAAEEALTADHNAEMVERIARWPRLRDRAVFVGNPDDLVDDPLGPGLPTVREWTVERYAFSGYVSDFAPVDADERARLRAELGWRPDETVCVATVGGSGVGGDLLSRVVAAFPAARRAVPGLRLVVVAGPRLDPARLPAREGLEVHGYVHRLHRLLAACDLAVTHGGLTTTMTLTAHRRPFLYVPLRNHFEQNRHVRHRLDAYRAGRFVDYGQTEPEALAALIAAEAGRRVDYRPVETDGADRAAALLADLF